MELKIIEWNINQRANIKRKDMPDWIAKVIADEKADLICLTEVYRGNNWENIKNNAFSSNYAVFETSNNTIGQNDVVIAVNIKKLDVVYAKTYYPYQRGIPDYLEVKCRSKNADNIKEFVFIGVRIHSLVRDDIKREELEYVMTASKDNDTVIVCGDFNNNRRGYKGKWCLEVIKNICDKNHYDMGTPKGSSIYVKNPNNVDYEFPEDHFLFKGDISVNKKDLLYDRDFTKNDIEKYIWGQDFQKYMGKDDKGNPIYESVNPPFPDHAILKGIFDIWKCVPANEIGS